MTLPRSYKRVNLAERPEAKILPSTFVTESLPLPEPKDGEVLVRVDYLSIDPAMRGWLKERRSYTKPIPIGGTMRAGGVGTVVTDGKNFKKGDIVYATLGWNEYVIQEESWLRKLEPPAGITARDYLGPLGTTGLTAYFGTIAVGEVKAGQTFVVSGAAGATGSMVCQIGKILGAKVVAIAGSDDKCKHLKDLGVDITYNYKEAGWQEKFAEEVGYLDVYFDNVGGEITDYFLTRLNEHARIVLCGAVSDYNNSKPRGLSNYQYLIVMRGRIQGFIVFDYEKDFPKGEADIAKWLSEGKVKHTFHVEKVTIDKCPEVLGSIFEGKNTGKLIVEVQHAQ